MQGVHVLAIERRVVDPAPPFSSRLTCQTNKVLLGISYVLKILLEVKRRSSSSVSSSVLSWWLTVALVLGTRKAPGDWTRVSLTLAWGSSETWSDVRSPGYLDQADCLACGAEELMMKNLHY